MGFASLHEPVTGIILLPGFLATVSHFAIPPGAHHVRLPGAKNAGGRPWRKEKPRALSRRGECWGNIRPSKKLRFEDGAPIEASPGQESSAASANGLERYLG
jgi:hypothetical protein